MSLKSATLLAVICLIIVLVFRVAQWTIFAFDLLDFVDFEWLFRAMGLISMLLESGCLIAFFLVLYSKQAE